MSAARWLAVTERIDFMRKILAIITTVCFMVSVLCMTAFAAESTSVIKVQYDSEVKEFSAFEDGWNYAMETAKKGQEVYVTLLTDWILILNVTLLFYPLVNNGKCGNA